jgi:TatD DNase family protein
VAVSRVLTVGIDIQSSKRCIDIATAHGLWASVGIHPNSASGWSARDAEAVGALVSAKRVAAVGETGLDLYRDAAPLEDQLMAFSAHIELAIVHDKALIVHTRDSVGRALEVLEDGPRPERLIFHCWSGTGEELTRALVVGAYISFAGNVSFKNAQNLRDIARQVPSNRLLIETDSPFLSPVPHRGKLNEPSRIPEVGAAIASARDEDPAEVAACTWANAHTVLGLES